MSGALSDEAVTALVRASAAVAAWSLGRAKPGDVGWSLRLAAGEADPEAVEEVLLQLYLFLGFPACLNAFRLWRELSDGPAPPPTPPEPGGWSERGAEVCGRVYGAQAEELRANIRELHPDMERWMVEEGYGKVLGRPGLELRVRELCIVSVLAVTGWADQLYSHLRGALNAGATEREVDDALECALRMVDEPTAGRARATWERLLARRGGADEG